MSTITIQIPESLRRHAERIAAEDGISLDQFLATAVAEKLAAMETVDYIARRAKRANERFFDEILRKSPEGEPEADWDKMPS